jgi:hypothetical protein
LREREGRLEWWKYVDNITGRQAGRQVLTLAAWWGKPLRMVVIPEHTPMWLAAYSDSWSRTPRASRSRYNTEECPSSA